MCVLPLQVPRHHPILLNLEELWGLGFGVCGLEIVFGLGIGDWGLEFVLCGLEIGVCGLGIGDCGLEFGVRLRVWGVGS